MPKDAILVKADVVRLDRNISHDLGLESFSKRLNETNICKVSTEEIISIADLKNNYFEYNEKFCK